MKKHLTISFLCIFMIAVFAACNSSSVSSKLSSYEWKLESMSYLDGSQVVDIVDTYQMTFVFEENTFTLTDETNSKVQTGTYFVEKTKNSSETYKLDMSFDNSETKMTGAYGIRTSVDGSSTPSIILQSEDKVFSFIAE